MNSSATLFLQEDGKMREAAPQCTDGLGWVYFKGHCYMFTSWHLDFLAAEEQCNQVQRRIKLQGERNMCPTPNPRMLG